MDLHFGTYWSLRRVRLLSSDDKMRSRFTQQGWAAHLTPAGACFLVAGALQKDRDRIRFSHLHALLVPLPPTGSVLERLEQQRRALPEGARPNVRESAAEPRGTMFAQRFGTPGGRGTCGSGQDRTWSRRKCGRRLARGVTKNCFMLPESGPDLGAGIRPPGMGLDS